MGKDLDKKLEFEIEKTYSSFFKSGEVLGNSFLTYILLLSITALFVFGKSAGIEDKVTVPFLQLTLSKPYAAAVCLLLSCAALYWFAVTCYMHILLAEKLKTLIKERYEVSLLSNWYLQYPSPLTSSFLTAASKFNFIFVAVIFGSIAFFVIGSFSVPLYFSWKIAGALQLALPLKALYFLITFLLLVPTATTYYFMTREDSDALIKSLDQESV